MSKRSWKILMILIGLGGAAASQTLVDLRTQSKSVDFTGANTTRPLKSGITLPLACAQGEMFFKNDAPAGSNLYACTAANNWTTEAGGGGAADTVQLGDFAVSQSGSVTLVIGSQCSLATHCNIRFGNVTYTFQSGATATISGGSGTAYIYISSNGTLTVGHVMTVLCSSGCMSQSGVTAFPPDSIPLATWTATSGVWDTNGGADRRGFLSTKAVVPGLGMMSTEVSGETILSVDASQVGLRAPVPPTAATACTPGTWSADASYFYVCVAASTWRRSALAIW
jgi:hypothetical protein